MRTAACLTDALMRTANGDAIAFRQVYRLTSTKLSGICARICGCGHAGDDVMQEVYVTVWQRAGSFDPAKGSAIAWLSRIARNRAIDWRRIEVSGRSVPIEFAELIIDDRLLVEEILLLEESTKASLLCLSLLNPDYRDAITATFLGQSTHAEFARISGVPLGTMKSRIRRGLRKLRDDMEAHQT